jgi:hypothetical protein
MVSLNSTKINSDNLHNEEQNGMMFVEFDEHEPPPPPQTSNNNNNGGGSDNQNNLASVDNISAGTALTTTDSTNRLSNNQKKGTPKLLPSNPWETLDPHDPEDIPEKVPKKGRVTCQNSYSQRHIKKEPSFNGFYKKLTCTGRTWKLPSGLTLPNSKTSKDTQTTRPLLFSKMATNSLIDHPLLVDYMSANYLMGPFFVEFQYLYDVEMKKRAQEIKHAKQNRTVQVNKQMSFSQFLSLIMLFVFRPLMRLKWILTRTRMITSMTLALITILYHLFSCIVHSLIHTSSKQKDCFFSHSFD